MRCISCIRTGEWPPRLHDVEETEIMLANKEEQLEEAEHIKQEMQQEIEETRKGGIK